MCAGGPNRRWCTTGMVRSHRAGPTPTRSKSTRIGPADVTTTLAGGRRRARSLAANPSRPAHRPAAGMPHRPSRLRKRGRPAIGRIWRGGSVPVRADRIDGGVPRRGADGSGESACQPGPSGRGAGRGQQRPEADRAVACGLAGASTGRPWPAASTAKSSSAWMASGPSPGRATRPASPARGRATVAW
jgi:hypothetical protein